MDTFEEKFFASLKRIFIGEDIEGESGFVNLMRIKSSYFQKFSQVLKKDVEYAIANNNQFKEEIYEKLYSFFKKYFSDNGSIYFVDSRYDYKIYDQIYTNNADILLFWKTRDLYYIKSDILPHSMTLTLCDMKFHFDVSSFIHKKAWEKKTIVFHLEKIQKEKDIPNIIFKVEYSERGERTDLEKIIEILKKEGLTQIKEDLLIRAFSVFVKQTEVDYFINKNSGEFLKEQFLLWLYKYEFSDQSTFTVERLNQLKTLQNIAFSIIHFVSQFENELVKIWNKPRFVLNSNYVITFDKLANKNIEIIKKIFAHKKLKEQKDEWINLGLVSDESFDQSVIIDDTSTFSNGQINEKFKYLFIDTKFFKDLENEILSLFDNLEEDIDGWLINSENYQCLNTLLPKFKEKIQLIYIDPPFNKDKNADYYYNVKFKDSTWITMLENRIAISKDLLGDRGSIFVRCDYNGNMYLRLLLDEIFDKNFRNEIIVKRGKVQFGESNKYTVATDSLYWYSKTGDYLFKKFSRPRYSHEAKGSNFILEGERNPRERTFYDGLKCPRLLLPPPGTHFKFVQEEIDKMDKKGIITLNNSRKGIDSGFMEMINGEWKKTALTPHFQFDTDKSINSNWTDISGYSTQTDFETENSEDLLERVIISASKEKDIVMDFFLGSGTTIAVAHKLRRKWIGVEMGSHFWDIILPRMKKVVSGEQDGISKKVKWAGGGFFKYYEMEQYEDILKRAKYADSEPLFSEFEKPYNEYIFLKDLKMLNIADVDTTNEKIHVNLNQLYQDIDVMESLSCWKGYWIKRIVDNKVELFDGSIIDLHSSYFNDFRNHLWW